MEGAEFLTGQMPTNNPTLEDYQGLHRPVSVLTSELTRQSALLEQTAVAAASASGPAPVRSQQGPKPSKPEVFSSGKESGSAAAWLFSQRLYFEATNTADEYKVPFAVTFLRGSAALWWQAHLRHCDNGIVARLATWDSFSAEFLTQFAPINSVKSADQQHHHLPQPFHPTPPLQWT